MSTTAADLLRPTDFSGYVGQERMKAELAVRITSAKRRREPFPHTLLVGPAGSGKTTLAHIIANALGTFALCLEMPLQRDDYRSMREANGFLFIDEVHRGTTAQKEELLGLLERNEIRPKGQARISWDHLTVIAATTEPGKLPRPVRDRFIVQPYFDAYSDSEMAEIGMGMAQRLGISLDDDSFEVLARAAAGVPRRLSHLITAARDLIVTNDTTPTAADVLDFVRCTPDGLTPHHVEYLRTLYRQAPLGLRAIRQMIDMDESGIIELERLLVRLDYIEKTGQGRDLTTHGYQRARQLEGR